MAVNLINKLRNELTSDVVGRIASMVGESPANTQSAIGYVLPAAVGMLAQKAQTPQGATDLVGMIQRAGIDGTESVASLLGTGTPAADRLNTGTSLMSSLFGTRASSLVDFVASHTGVRPQSVTSLLALVTPLVLHMLRRETAASGAFDASSVASLLGGQAGFLRSLMPAGLASVLGLSGFDEPAPGYAAPVQEPGRAYAHAVSTEPARGHDRGRGMPWLKWAVPLLLVALLVWGLTAIRHRAAARRMAAAIGQGTTGTTGTVPLVKQRLSCGQVLDVAPDGVERKLVAFIDDGGRSPDDRTWFTFDRLAFDTGSATLASTSEPQIRNIAAILRCYPNVAVKFGGYTDNTGDPAANQRLSQARAESARAAVVSQGIAPGRIAAEGYGQEHPVASNDAEAGRQRNRRIDILVVRK